MRAPRWTAVSQSAFEWEREALDFLRDHLPDHEPWRAWSNFEFIDDEGRVNEVDVGLVLIEVKSRPGTLRGDAYSWTWTTEGRQITTDNPLPLANRKAKRLASVLRRQEALTGRGAPRVMPWVEPLIFLFKVRQRPALDPGTERRVALRGRPTAPDDDGIIGTLLRAEDLGFGRRGPINPAATRAVLRAIEQAGIRAPGRGRRVGDYELGQLVTAKTGRTSRRGTRPRALPAGCASTPTPVLPRPRPATGLPGRPSGRPASWKASSTPAAAGADES